MTDLLFVFPNIELPSKLRFAYHSGVGCVIAYLKSKGIEADMFLQDAPIQLQGVAEKIVERNPEMVGFTCYDGNYHMTKLISQRVKQLKPGIKIIMGGPTASFSDRLIMEDNPAIDVCVRGEGEYTTHELVTALKNNLPLENIPGLTYRRGDDIRRTGTRDYIKELDTIPSPYLEGLSPIPPNREFALATSRGCYYQCTYCQFAAMFGWKVRFYSLERILEELRFIGLQAEREIKGERYAIEFIDDSFCVNRKRVEAICDYIRSEPMFKNADFGCQTRADTINGELLELLYNTGFKRIGFGLESGVPRILRKIKKARIHDKSEGLEPELKFLDKVRNAVKMAKEIGFYTTVSIILGLPGETLEEGRKTIEFVESLGVDRYIHNYLMFFPGTDLFVSDDQGIPGRRSAMEYGSYKGCLYKTEYNYDIYKAPVLQNVFFDSDTFNLANFTSGNLQTYRDQSPYPAALFLDTTGTTPATSLGVFEWLREIISFSSRVFLTGDWYNEARYLEFRKECAQSGAPVFNLLFARERKVLDAALGFDTYPNVYDILSSPFSANPPDIEDPTRQVVNLTLNNEEDIETLCQLTRQADEIGRFTLDGSFANPAFVVEDACRWGCEKCPAMSLTKMIVTGDDRILPCRHGKDIGNVGDSPEDMKKRLAALREAEILRRGCESCPVKDSCSQCLFPHPMDADRYCRLRKEFPLMCEIFNLADIVKKVKLPSLQVGVPVTMYVSSDHRPTHHDDEPVDRGGVVIKKSIRGLHIQGKYYIYDMDKQTVRPVNNLLMDILIHLKGRAVSPAWVRRLAKKYNAAPAAIEKTIDEAVRLAEKLGYTRSN